MPLSFLRHDTGTLPRAVSNKHYQGCEHYGQREQSSFRDHP